MSPEPTHVAHAYGLTWASDIPLVQFESADANPVVDVTVCRAVALLPRAPLAQVRAGAVFADGTRFPWHRQAVFDMTDGRTIDYLPGPTWSGALPHAFYGTVVAHLLAWRGIIPLHACAVEIDGRAVLIAGDAGAGKSSLTAGLIAQGTALVSDDLSAIAFDPVGGGAQILPGRTTIRLDPTVARWTEGELLDLPARDTRGKAVVRPAERCRAPLPLAGMIALGLPSGSVAPVASAGLLAAHLFRPVWLAALPNNAARHQALLALAAILPVRGFPAVAGGGAETHAARARAALALARDL